MHKEGVHLATKEKASSESPSVHAMLHPTQNTAELIPRDCRSTIIIVAQLVVQGSFDEEYQGKRSQFRRLAVSAHVGKHTA